MKIRRCRVCRQYTIKLKHCNLPTDKANPPDFKLRIVELIVKYQQTLPTSFSHESP